MDRDRAAARSRNRFQLPQQLVSGLPPVGWVLFEAAVDTLGQSGRKVAAVLVERLGRLSQMGRQHLLRRDADKGRTTGQQLVGQDPDGIDVGPVVDIRLRCGLLRRHVAGRSQRHTGRRDGIAAVSRVAQRLGHSEIRYLWMPPGQQHVVRLDVAMHHPA